MAEVYTGKIAIPGDKIEEYFEILKTEEEKKRAIPATPFTTPCTVFFYYLEEKILSTHSKQTCRNC